MSLLVALAFVLQQTDTAVHNATILVDRDWGYKHLDANGYINDYLLLSLKKGERWDKGTAWLVLFSADTRNGSSTQACRGVYEFYGNQLSDDTLLLKLAFTRKYAGSSLKGGLRDWSIVRTYAEQPTAVLLEIPLVDRSVPDGQITAVVSKAFWVDAQGEIIHRQQQVSLWEALKGEGGEEEVTSTGHLTLGSTLKLQDNDLGIQFLQQSPPPGFRLRDPAVRAAGTGSDGLSAARRAALLLCDAAAEKGEFDSALRGYSALIEKYPLPSLYCRRGYVYARKEQYDKAVDDYSASLSLTPNGEVLYFRGHAYRALRKYAEALADFRESLRLSAKDPRPYNDAAWLLATCNDDALRNAAEAVEDAKKACELTGWKDAFYFDTLAAAYAEAGAFATAVEWQEKAVAGIAKQYIEGAKQRLELFKQGKPYREP